jgi:ornithine cyclodeaminase/alanine dehydrogenase-like protein (mu-crystallin family)
MGENLDIPVQDADSASEATRDTDIIITGTRAEEPVLLSEYVLPGTHIAAMGNQPEVDPRIYLRAKVFTELLQQSKLEGKLSYAIKSGVVNGDVSSPTRDVIAGKTKGRTSSEEITLYDSQGLAAHDAFCAWEAYTGLSEKGRGQWVEMDLRYIDNWSLWLDVQILLRTIPAVLFGKGAK